MQDNQRVPVTDGDDQFLREINLALEAEASKLGASAETLDMYILVYLRRMARFGFFAFGPLTIDLHVIEDIVERTTPKGSSLLMPAWSDDLVRFSQLLTNEVRRSGRRRIDELHFLLAFMRGNEGLPARVFGELNITPEQIEAYARKGQFQQPLEKLFSPEEAAEYLQVHVQTVRAWIRSGRLRAKRLAGQRALRITASDLASVMEPLEEADEEEASKEEI